MLEFIPCRKCKGKNGKVAPEGYISTWVEGKNGSKVEVLTECDCHKKWVNECKVEARAKKANLNLKWINFNPEKDYVGTKSLDSVKRVISYTNKSLDKSLDKDKRRRILSSSLYIYGRNGTQKTTVANYMGYEFLRAGKKVKYFLMNDLIKLLQKADRDEDIRVELDKISEESDLLIIDESFDKKKVTLYKSDFQIPFLDTFLRNRLQTVNKGIIFISNVSIDEIEDNGFTSSIQDLVKRNVPAYGILNFDDKFDEEKSDIDTEELF